MAYTKGYPLWKDDPDHSTPIVAAKLNNFETGISDAHTDVAALTSRMVAEEAQPNVPAVVNGQWLKGSGGALIFAAIGISDVTSLQAALDAKAVAANAVLDGDAAGGVLSGTFPAPGFAQDMATQAELDVAQGTVQTNLDTHIADAVAAHPASAIAFEPIGSLQSTTVQAAIAEAAVEGGGGGGGGSGYLNELFDVTGQPPDVGDGPVWDGDSYHLIPVASMADLTAAVSGIDMSQKVDKDSVVDAATRLVAVKLLAGDAQPAFRIRGDGTIEWGAGGASALDVGLYRHLATAVLATTGWFAPAKNIGTAHIGARYALGSNWLSAVFSGSLRFDGTNWVNEPYGGNNGWGLMGVFGAGGGGLEFYTDAATGNTPRSYTEAQFLARKMFAIAGDGKLLLGALQDTNLYRYAANVLATDDQIRVLSTSGICVVGVAGGNYVRGYLADGDAQPAMKLLHNALEFGPGGASVTDVSIYRGGVSILASGDKFDPASLNLQTKAGVPADGDVVGGAADGDIVVDTTNHRIYARSGGSWRYVGIGTAGAFTKVRQPIRLRVPRTSTLAGNASFSVTALTAWDMAAWEFIDAQEGRVYGHVHLPPALIGTSCVMTLVSAASVAGNAVVQVKCHPVAAGGSLNPAAFGQSYGGGAITLAASYALLRTQYTITPLASDQILLVEITRLGAHASDTLLGIWYLLDAYIEYDAAA